MKSMGFKMPRALSSHSQSLKILNPADFMDLLSNYYLGFLSIHELCIHAQVHYTISQSRSHNDNNLLPTFNVKVRLTSVTYYMSTVWNFFHSCILSLSAACSQRHTCRKGSSSDTAPGQVRVSKNAYYV